MSNLFTERVLNMAAVTPLQAGGLQAGRTALLRQVSHSSKLLPEKASRPVWRRDRHPAECDCQANVWA